MKIVENKEKLSLCKIKEIIDNADLTTLDFATTVAILEMYEYLKSLSRVAIETAFDKQNEDTELLCRRLLAMGEIELKDGMYSRKPFDFEEHFRIDGVEYDREKMFFIEEDKLDEYTKQLEEKIKRLENNNGVTM